MSLNSVRIDNNRAYKGGAISIIGQSSLNIQSSSINDNYGLEGGVLYCNGCNAIFRGVNFVKNNCYKGCIVFDIQGMPKIEFYDSSVQNSDAFLEGALAYIDY